MPNKLPRKKEIKDCQWTQVATSDGLRLDGMLHQAPSHSANKDSSLDPADAPIAGNPVALLMHGAGANFYGPSLINRVGTHLHRDGWSVLRANNRGHDGWHVAFRGGKMINLGAAFERLEESILDVLAWVDWLVRNNFGPIWLVGHSLGAFKSLYALNAIRHRTEYQSRLQQIQGIIAISPPCLSQSLFQNSDQGDLFCQTVQHCQQMIENGQVNDVFQATYPFPMLISPGCYLNKYVSGEAFNFTQWLDSFDCPLYWIFGQDELASHVALAEGVKQLQQALPEGHQLKIFPNADHFFTGSTREVCVEVAHWIKRFR